MGKEAHLKWLSKAKTAKIDGVELTVLPYGYLQQAVVEAYTRGREEGKEAKDESAKVAYDLCFALKDYIDEHGENETALEALTRLLNELEHYRNLTRARKS